MSITYTENRNAAQERESRNGSANFPGRTAAGTSASPQLASVLIEQRQLIRDCLARALRSATGHEVIALSSVDEWLNICERTPASVLLLSAHGRSEGAELRQAIRRLCEAKRRLPTVILSDADDIRRVVDALDWGVKGYIPTNLPLDVVVEAMRLVRAGGVFVPAGCISAAHENHARPSVKTPLSGMFTERQQAVIAAVRQGKANKTIAYDLQLQESTVKVHIRNIMRKLKAKNRTEVAYIVNQIASQDQSDPEVSR